MFSSAEFELHGLQKLFVTCLTTVNNSGGLFNADVIRAYVIGEVGRIKHRLLEKAVTIDGEDAIRRYVRVHQNALVEIMDKLFQHSWEPAARSCYEALEGLLVFLQEHFSGYFDERGKAPLRDVKEMRIDVGLSLPLLEKDLKPIVSDYMGSILLHPLTWFALGPREQKVSFCRLRHLGYILKHVEKLRNDVQEYDGMEEKAIQFLLYLNYNSKKTFIELTRYVDIMVQRELDIDGRIGSLSRFLKVANQATVKTGTAYHAHAPTLKSQLINYLTAELTHLAEIRKQDERAPVPPEAVIPFKVKVNLSVAQLGCLLRFCTETGLISSGNKTELIRCVARTFETKKAEGISAESLKIKYYDIQTGTHRAVQERLRELVKTTERLLG